jgi:MoaA/NifB/PqqE/SkfB family radical SAM enzyme
MNKMIKKPELIEIVLNDICNYKCKMCNIWKNKKIHEICFNDLKKIIFDISVFNDTHNSNNNNKITIQFIGGETLLYKDLDKAICYASKLNINTSITTNCSLLSKQKIIELSNVGLNHINLSLDSTEKKIHNYLRGNKNSYDHIINAISNLETQGKNIRLGINTIINELNLHDLKNISDFAKNTKRIDQIYFIALEKPYNSNYNNDWRTNSPVSYLWPKDKKIINETFDLLISQKIKNKKIENSISQLQKYRSYYLNPETSIKSKGCKFGYDHLLINPQKDIYFCTQRTDIDYIKNSKEIKIVELWNSKKAQNIRQKMENCTQNCVQVLSCVYNDE